MPARSATRDGLAHLSGATMTNDADLMPDLGQEDAFEVQRRGYSRRQVDEFAAKARGPGPPGPRAGRAGCLTPWTTGNERLGWNCRRCGRRPSGKPAHEEISERVEQILKLADDEAKSQRGPGEQEEITKLRTDAKQETGPAARRGRAGSG